MCRQAAARGCYAGAPPQGDPPPASVVRAAMAGRGVRTDTDRIDDDRVPPNEHGRAVAVGGHDVAMQVVGDEPIHHRERRPGATGGQGFEGGRSVPLARAQCTHM